MNHATDLKTSDLPQHDIIDDYCEKIIIRDSDNKPKLTIIGHVRRLNDGCATDDRGGGNAAAAEGLGAGQGHKDDIYQELYSMYKDQMTDDQIKKMAAAAGPELLLSLQESYALEERFALDEEVDLMDRIQQRLLARANANNNETDKDRD